MEINSLYIGHASFIIDFQLDFYIKDKNKGRSEKMIEQTWGIRTEKKKVIRDSEKKIYAIRDIEGDEWIVKGEKAPLWQVEQQAQFANKLIGILPVPRYKKTQDEVYAVAKDGLTWTIETRQFGREVNHLTDSMLLSMATMLGKLHAESLRQSYRFHRATSWSLFGGNATEAIGDYDENELSFLEMKAAYGQENIFEEIETQYLAHRTYLKNCWKRLPIAAVQGDFCHYNMLFDGDCVQSVFDFNLAGDERLLNECIAVAVYCCWHVESDSMFSAEERYTLFTEAYQKHRVWTKEERVVAKRLKAIIRAFRYDRVARGIENVANRHLFLEETLQILKT